MSRAPEDWRALLATALRYGVVGVLGTLSHFATTIALVELAHTDPVVATTAGFLVALVVSFTLARGWVFRHRAPVARTFPRYVAVSTSGLVLNAAIMYVTVNVARLDYLWGLAAVVLIVPAFNFTLNRAWTFS